MPLIQLGPKYFESSFIAVIEGEGKNHTKIWLNGSSPVDGAFIVPLPLDVVLTALAEARYREIAEDLARAERVEHAGEGEFAGTHEG